MSYTVRVTHRTQQNYQQHNHIVVQVFLGGGGHGITQRGGKGGTESSPHPKQFLISIIAYRLFYKLKCLKDIARYTKQCFHIFLSCSKLVFHSSFCSNEMNTVNVKPTTDQTNLTQAILYSWGLYEIRSSKANTQIMKWISTIKEEFDALAVGTTRVDRNPFWK